MPKRTDIKKIMIIGAGPIVIGQACEFDYSGSQACKALRQEGYKIILVNSNPATIMTDPDVADVTYIEPINDTVLEEIIKKEKPNAILPTMGGQTGLNAAMSLDHNGILKKYSVELIGANAEAIDNAENRVKVIKSNFFNPELTLSKGTVTKIKPDNTDLINIKKGIKILYKLNAYNHIQGLVIKNKVTIKKEDSKGTKKMLQSINKKNKGGILIKFPKKKQDLRADLPTIGLETLKDCSKANLKGIVLSANQNIFLDQKKSISFANKKKIFISVL